MNTYIWFAIGIALGLVVALLFYLVKRNTAFKSIAQSTEIAENIKKEAALEAENTKKSALLEARDEWFKQKKILDEEVKERQRELRIHP